jgi:hypothetical protein
MAADYLREYERELSFTNSCVRPSLH